MSPVAVSVAGARMLADPSGALLWPEAGVLAVADLHLEKGSALAARGGALVPPYDTRATLERLAALVRTHRPRMVVCLGDSFHDGEAEQRLDRTDCARLARLVESSDWIWIAGNHDPSPPAAMGGRVMGELRLGPLCFRHEAATDGMISGEVSGHYHPKARVRLRARRVSARCFVTDGRRVILPSFGAYTGGLDVRDDAIESLFPRGYQVVVTVRGRAYAFARHHLKPPPDYLALEVRR